MIKFEDLKNGFKLGSVSVYIDTLADDIEIQLVPLSRYNEYKDAEGDAEQQEKVGMMVVAESLSSQSGMTFDESAALCEQVKTNLPPAAWDEIQNAIMGVMFGKKRVAAAQVIAEATPLK